MSEAGIRSATNRIRLMVMRVVLALVSDGKKMQTVQVQGMADLVREPEHFQHYGFTSVPLPGAEGIGLSLGGSTNHMVVINVDDRRYRMKGLVGGEVAFYDEQGQSVHLTRNGIVIKGAGLPMRFTDTPSITFDTPNVFCTGNLFVDKTTSTLNYAMRSGGTATATGGTITYTGCAISSNGKPIDHTHVHHENGAGANTDPPS